MTEKEIFCLNALLVDKGAVDLAYLLSREKPPKVKDGAILHKMALRWLRGAEIKSYLEGMQKALTSKEESSVNQNRKKDDIISELNTLASATKDIKQRTEILMKIADLQRMKQEEHKDEEKTVHFYLPQTCHSCSLYIEKKGELLSQHKILPDHYPFDPIVRHID